jgi:hypothetical protein
MYRNSTSKMEPIRKQKDLEEVAKCLEYPFSYITPASQDLYNYGYSYESIHRPIVVETPEEQADGSGFPHNIKEYYWVQEGENDGDEWIALGKLENGAFFYFTASCDYTGFDCQGGMNLWVSNSFKNILDHAMAPRDREKFLVVTDDEVRYTDEYERRGLHR